jgi:hypothetical protein
LLERFVDVRHPLLYDLCSYFVILACGDPFFANASLQLRNRSGTTNRAICKEEFESLADILLGAEGKAPMTRVEEVSAGEQSRGFFLVRQDAEDSHGVAVEIAAERLCGNGMDADYARCI